MNCVASLPAKNNWIAAIVIMLTVTCVSARNLTSDVVVAIVVDDDKPAAALKVASYVDDYLNVNTTVITRSQYQRSSQVFAAVVDIMQSARSNQIGMAVEIVKDRSRAVYGSRSDINNRVSWFVLHNRQAMKAAVYILRQLSTDDWRGLVELFEDEVDDLDD
jgi:hypothetical protein